MSLTTRLAARTVVHRLLLMQFVFGGPLVFGDELAHPAPLPAPLDRTIDFGRDVLPILQRNCFGCHQGENSESGRRLDYRDAVLGTSSDQAFVVPGKSADSRLIHLVSSADNESRMPPEGKGEPLSAEQIGVLRAWIDQGLPWHDDQQSSPEAALRHWAFQPVVRPAVPIKSAPLWGRSVTDAFVLAELRNAGLQPTNEADRATLIRRLAFVLTGLPPSPDDVLRFAVDSDLEAYEHLVDRLLASPRFGEQLARMWLDVVRYAETEGFEYDNYLPGMWKYRDYVIRSFNDDKPYDQFVREQLAGDELNPTDHESLIAAGFHRLGSVRRNAGNQNVASSRNEVLTEQTNIIGSALLGLTIGCARCHDHRFDPLPQDDYYRLQAFLASTYENNVPVVAPEQHAEWSATTQELNRQIKRLKDQLMAADLTHEVPLREQIKQLENQLPAALPTICTVVDVADDRTPIHVLARGLPENPGLLVGMRLPRAVVDTTFLELPSDTVLPRRILADQITDPGNPLTARVFVNRLWAHIMGRGIVNTPNDFGRHGDPPSHPDLLSYLTCEFIEGGWRIKPMIRQMVMSSTFRQSIHHANAADVQRVDPDNRLLSKFNHRRLTAEEIRDAMLSVSGRLSKKMGGESVVVDVDVDLIELLYKPSQWQVTKDWREHDRRSIYLLAKRNLRLPLMEVFDQPDLQTSCPKRESSTHALQSLEMLNGRLSNELAMAFAERLRVEAKDGASDRVELAFKLALGRPPNADERRIAERFVFERPLREFALAMFNLNGFIYVE